ncbi:Uncharacterised protein [BD1-7 clade bacterium]|uniref:Uncharacterized protein n=1 Tax=BD1-7 clade bacterium TaxID=2029982 RepID=A0A5S9QZW1_9GAMM|nr:Uncharacterised protein [BD1-7 clade bacterium]
MNIVVKKMQFSSFIPSSFFLLLVSVSGIASGAGWMGTETITELGFSNDGLLIRSAGWIDASNCESNDSGMVDSAVLKYTDRNYDHAYSLILSAFMAKKRVTLYSDDCSANGGSTNSVRGFKHITIKD